MRNGIDSDEHYVKIKIMGDGNATVAHANLFHVGGASSVSPVAFGEGSAVREPSDKNDDVTAVTLAAGRALESLGKRLVKQANGRIKHADSNKVHAAELKAKREAAEQMAPYDFKIIPLDLGNGESIVDAILRYIGGAL